MTRGCGLTPSLLLGCHLCDIISHTELPRGEGHRWALSSASKVMVNDHWCPLAKECRSRKRNMQCCLQVQQSFSGSYSHNVRHAYSHSHSVCLSLSHTHTHSHTLTDIFTPSFPKTAKISEGILFGWNHGWADGVCEAHPHSWNSHASHATHHHWSGHAHIHAHVHSHHALVCRNSPHPHGTRGHWRGHICCQGGRHAHRHGIACHHGIGWWSNGCHVGWGAEVQSSKILGQQVDGRYSWKYTCEQRQLIHLGCKAL